MNYIEITTIADVQAIANDLAGHYRLVADIDAAETKNWNGGKGFKPIGNDKHRFKGVLDGNGHTISNMSISRDEENCVGLLGCLESGEVLNLTLVNSKVSGRTCVGGLVGSNSGRTTKCQVSGEVTGDGFVGGLVGKNEVRSITTKCQASCEVAGRNFVGGLVGHNNGSITECQVFGEVTGIENCVGGLAGSNDAIITKCRAFEKVAGVKFTGGLVGSNDGDIIKCHASGEVVGEGKVGGIVGMNRSGRITECQASVDVFGKDNVGGIAGDNNDKGIICDCQAFGKVLGADILIGGLVGNNYGNITKCHVSGKVAGKGLVGGLVGGNNEGRITESYWDIQTTGQRVSNGGGEGKTSAEMKCRTTFVGWDFEKVWQIEEGRSYPTLRCFAQSNVAAG